ncbi:hypothetical protein D3C81_1816030 [compost metagenome]
MGDRNEFTRLQPLDNAAHGRLVDGGGARNLAQRAWPLGLDGAHDDELAGRQLRVWNGLLEDGDVPLVGTAQQMSNLLGEFIVSGVG